MNLNDLAKEIHDNALRHGWWDADRNFGETLMLIVSEASEALEEWRDGRPFDETYFKGDKPEGVPSELADIIIRVLDACAGYGVDIQDAVEVKMSYNRTRPYKHGRKI